MLKNKLLTQAQALRQADNNNLTMTTALGKAGMPAGVLARLNIGEQSGKLEQELNIAAIEQLEIFESRTTWAVKLLNGFVYGFAVLVVAAVIISMMLGYISLIQSLR